MKLVDVYPRGPRAKTNLVVTGKAGAGKDELASILIAAHGYRRVALADRLKAIAKLLYPIEFRAGGDPLVRRKRLQRLGDDLREKEPRVFSRALAEELEIEGAGNGLVLSDARYVDEWEVFRERFAPCRLVRVITPDPIRFERLFARDGKVMDAEAMAHPSENGLVDVDVPGVLDVDNSGSRTDLREAAYAIVSMLAA